MMKDMCRIKLTPFQGFLHGPYVHRALPYVDAKALSGLITTIDPEPSPGWA